MCNTKRVVFFKKITNLVQDTDLLVFSFQEEPFEPLFEREIEEFTISHNGYFVEGKMVGSEKFENYWKSRPIDLLFAVNWRYLVPKRIYSLAKLGAYVFHDSLLPAYRGFSPTVWAIVNGETNTGVSLFEMAEEFDTGDIIDQKAVHIGNDDTIADILPRVTEVYLEILENNLYKLISGDIKKFLKTRAKLPIHVNGFLLII